MLISGIHSTCSIIIIVSWLLRDFPLGCVVNHLNSPGGGIITSNSNPIFRYLRKMESARDVVETEIGLNDVDVAWMLDYC